MSIQVNGLNKNFGDVRVIKQVSFEIESGKLVSLLGPSGCGKTTILRMLAGLEFPDTGDIYLNGIRVNDVPPQKRGIGFVFQNYALFKHMNVYDNIAFGLVIRKWKKPMIQQRVHELLALIGLSGLEKRFPMELSGGQRQRVAFARALAPKPELMLLDEPFASVDAKVRKELRSWLREMISQLHVTTIFVTHDQEEAIEVSDEIIVFNQGHLEQKGSPFDIYRQPQTPFVAHFIGDASLVTPNLFKGFQDVVGQEAFIRPEHVEVGHFVHVAAEEATIQQIQFLGNSWRFLLHVHGLVIEAYHLREHHLFYEGERVQIIIDRMYTYDGTQAKVIENSLKNDHSLGFSI